MPIPLVSGAIGSAVYVAWNAYVNVQRGQPWWTNWGVEASKGFVVGATLGLAAPALSAGSATIPVGAAQTPAGPAASPLRQEYRRPFDRWKMR